MVNQCIQFSTNLKILYDQSIKLRLKYLKGMYRQGILLKHDPEKGMECYIKSDLSGGWNQDKGTHLGLVLSIVD